MKYLVFLTLITFMSGCATQYDARLVGTWKSSREDTVANFYRRFPNRFEGSPEKKEKFANIFGKMIHTFTLNNLTVGYEDCVFTVGYRVLEAGGDYVVIKTAGNDGEQIKIRFVENLSGYWVNEDSDFSEKFTKISAEQVFSEDGEGRP